MIWGHVLYTHIPMAFVTKVFNIMHHWETHTVYVQILEGRKFRCFRGQLVIHEI